MIETSNPETTHPDLSAISDTVDRILQSTQFRGSAQLQTLLKYLVEVSLAGCEDALKERIIGIEVFGRKPDYDTADDPIARSRVGLLRKRLGQYYESGEAKGAKLQIVVPKGSYRPTFVFHPEANSEADSSLTMSQHESVVRAGDDRNAGPKATGSISKFLRATQWRKWEILVPLSCILILAAWEIFARSRPDELHLFWQPILQSNKTVLLYNGLVGPVYIQSGDSGDRVRSPSDEDPPALASAQSPTLGETPIPSDLAALPEGLMPPGDIAADLKVATLLNGYHRDLSLRSAGSLPFIDLKGSPAVLIGAYDNYWTLSLAKDLPFFYGRNIDIRERGGQHRVWSSAAGPDSTISDDYAIVFRLINSKTGGPVMGISGLTTCGTLAAAEFVTDSTQFRRVTNVSRNALGKENLEFVLHVSLINCSTASVEVVDQQVW